LKYVGQADEFSMRAMRLAVAVDKKKLKPLRCVEILTMQPD
jgi:hypothetical protein